jgi:putative serine/threonine protein kinase
MQREAELLKKANSVEVGPQLLGSSKDFVLMEFVDGSLLPEWLEKKRSKTIVKTTLHDVLGQCLRLDSIGLDHGELSNAPKHVIVDNDNKPVIVDFETASLNRRPSNVTGLCQFLFIGSGVAKAVARKLGRRNKKAIIEALRVYKNERSSENFGHVLAACGL